MITTAHLNIEKLELEKIAKNISVPHLSSCNCIGPQNNEPKWPCMHDLAKEGEPMCVSCPCPKCSARC